MLKLGKNTRIFYSLFFTVVSESMLSVDEANDKTCIFCGEFNENFDGAGLDVHYWKHCPMLKRCEKCKMVVEISGYR